MKEITEVLNFFSDLTQNTLSAFHLSDDDSDMFQEIENIKRILKNVKVRKLRTIEHNDDGTYTRYFTDGYTDIVNYDKIKSISYYTNLKEYDKLRKLLDSNHSLIVSLKLSKKITTSDWIDIKKPSEKMMFYIND